MHDLHLPVILLKSDDTTLTKDPTFEGETQTPNPKSGGYLPTIDPQFDSETQPTH